MPLFEKLKAAADSLDVAAYSDLMHDDCVFVRHQSGAMLNKTEMIDLLKAMKDAGARFGTMRRIYENDDILVAHTVSDFPDGSREAVLSSYLLKDGKVVRLETGATPLTA